MDSLKADRIEMMFKFMEYDNLTDNQHELIISFEEQYDNRGNLTDTQIDILSDIFKKAAEK